MDRFKMVLFWIRAFVVIIFQTMKGNTWNSVKLNVHLGDNEYGHPERMFYTARRTVTGLTFHSHHVPAFVPESDQETQAPSNS